MKMRTIVINTLLLLGIAAILVYVWQDKPPQPIKGFTIEQLGRAVEEGEVESLDYNPSTREIVGRLHPTARARYGGNEFHLSESLPLALYKRIQQQNLTATKFFGPIEGLDRESEFDALWTHAKNQVPVEDTVYDIQALTMPVGQLRIVQLPTIKCAHEECLHFRASAVSVSPFSSIYAIEDVAETFVRRRDGIPVGFSLQINESERFGGEFEAMTADGIFSLWTRVVSTRQGLSELKSSESRTPKMQNLLSIIFDLRNRDWNEPQTFVIRDHGKTIQINASRIGQEAVTTPLGQLSASIIKPQVSIDGEPKSADIRLWIQEGPPHALLRIEAATKIGRVRAELKEFQARITK